MSGWRKAKKLTAAASATRALTEMLPNLDDSQKHWVAFAVHLSLPMGLGFDHNHRVSEIKPTGSGFADGQVQVGDWLTHFDGVDLRHGKSIMDVLDRSRRCRPLAGLTPFDNLTYYYSFDSGPGSGIGQGSRSGSAGSAAEA